MNYDAEYVRQFYDAYGEREWERLQRDPDKLVNFHIHRHFLERFIAPGDRVLEAGAGPGRFTIELARLGAYITVGDISPTQLELNQMKVTEAGCEQQVVGREVLDIADLSRFETDSFDAVVCYGGPLSYLFERAESALRELLRVTRPGGHLFLSVMSLLGTTRSALPGVLNLVGVHGLEAVDHVIRTGDLNGDMSGGHRCHMFRWSELKDLLERQPCTIVGAAASGYLAPGQHLPAMEADQWERFLQWELSYCQEPAAIDGGTHMIAVVRKHGTSGTPHDGNRP